MKDYLFDWFAIDLYSFFGPYPILVGLYILNIIDLFWHQIGEAIIREPSTFIFLSTPFILTSFLAIIFKLIVKRAEIREHYKRKTSQTKSFGLIIFIALEFTAVVLGLIFGFLGFLQSYLMDMWDIRLQLLLYGFFVPNLISIMGRGYIGQSLIAKKLRLSERFATHLHAIGILIGTAFLIAGVTLFISPDITAQKGPLLAEDFAYARASSINPIRHELTLISTLPNNRIIVTEQFTYTKPGKYLFVYVFPYQIKSYLQAPNELSNERIIELDYENFPTTQSSVVWILWNSTSSNDARFGIGGILQGFEIDGAIYQNKKGHHSIILPLATTHKRMDPEHRVTEMIGKYQSTWIWDLLKLQLVIDGKATNILYSPQVEKEGLYHKFGVLQNNRELLWTIPNEQTVSVRYDILDQVQNYETSIFLSGVFLGVGIPLLIGSLFDLAKWRRIDFIRSSGVARIKNHIFQVWFKLFEIGASLQSRSQISLEDNISLANKLYDENEKNIERLFERIDSELIAIQYLLDPDLKPRIDYYVNTIDHFFRDFKKAVEEQREDIWYRDVNQLYGNIQRLLNEPD